MTDGNFAADTRAAMGEQIQIERSAREVRQAVASGRVLTVLIVSTILLSAIFGVIWATGY